MEEYLSAECVINGLSDKNIAKPDDVFWKRSAPETRFYTVELWKPDNSLIPLQISIINGEHCVRRNSIINQVTFYGLDIYDIIETCAL